MSKEEKLLQLTLINTKLETLWLLNMFKAWNMSTTMLDLLMLLTKLLSWLKIQEILELIQKEVYVKKLILLKNLNFFQLRISWSEDIQMSCFSLKQSLHFIKTIVNFRVYLINLMRKRQWNGWENFPKISIKSMMKYGPEILLRYVSTVFIL